MPKPVENISSDIIDLLKDRYEIADSIDEQGISTSDPSKIKVFSFNYVNSIGEDKGSVVISLLDDGESSNSIKIYFGQDLADSDAKTKKEWYAFLQDIRQFAKMHLLGFDVRNINKSQITRRDVEKDLKLVKEDLEPMFESSFGPIDGSVKTSKQPLGSMDIIIKHSARIDPKIKNSRSRKIQKIYLSNGKGERFLLPFKSLLAARAMARHIESGGTPYDSIGRDICQLVEEMLSLNKFYRTYKNSQFSNDHASEALASGRERYLEIKKTLASLSTKGGYAKNSVTMTGNAGELEDDDEMFEDIFDGVEMDEDNTMALPYINRVYQKYKSNKTPEENAFNDWVSAAKGQGEGQEILNDEDLPFQPEDFEHSRVRENEPTDIDPDQRNQSNITESKINEIFGFKKKSKNPKEELEKMTKMLTNLEFEQVVKQGDDEIWKRSYYQVIFGVLDGKFGWVMSRNGKPIDKGLNTISFAVSVLMEPDFKGELEYLVKKNNVTEADVPTSAGANSPLTYISNNIPNHFRSNKEIASHKNTTGKLSPFSLLNSPEQDKDADDKEITRIADLAKAPRKLSPNSAGFSNKPGNKGPSNI